MTVQQRLITIKLLKLIKSHADFCKHIGIYDSSSFRGKKPSVEPIIEKTLSCVDPEGGDAV